MHQWLKLMARPRGGDDDVSEMWREQREAQQARRFARLPKRVERLLALRAEGFEIEQKSPYHFRVNGRLDVWPVHNRYHDLKLKKRGGFPDVAVFVRRFFAQVKEEG